MQSLSTGGTPSPHLLSWLANNFNTPWAAAGKMPMPFAGLPPATSPNTFLQNNMHLMLNNAHNMANTG